MSDHSAEFGLWSCDLIPSDLRLCHGPWGPELTSQLEKALSRTIHTQVVQSLAPRPRYFPPVSKEKLGSALDQCHTPTASTLVALRLSPGTQLPIPL